MTNKLTGEGERTLAVGVRLLQLLDGLEAAGIAPVSNTNLHVFAYFVNVLSPLWEVDPLEGSVLKDEEGPFFPDLQRELDRFIVNEVVTVSQMTTQRNRITTKINLNYERAEELLKNVRLLPDERELATFIEQLAFAYAEIQPSERDDSAFSDATWSDPKISNGRVIDFGEWVNAMDDNPSWNVSQHFQVYATPSMILNRSEKLSMYMALMKKRIHG